MDIRTYLVKNTTETAASAPYTWRVIPNGVANLNDIVSGVLERISSSEERVRMALAESVKVALKHVLAGETVDLGGIRLKLQIPGSCPCEDTPFDPATDTVIVCAYVDDELRDTFDGVTPVKVSASDVASAIKVSNIMDETTELFGTVIGTTVAVALGNGITFDAEGEYIRAVDPKTGVVKQNATVVSVSKGQRARFKFDPQLPAGNWTIELATKGLVGESTPRIFRKPVTAIAVQTPPTPIAQTPDGQVKVMTATDGGQSAAFTWTHDWLLGGVNMFGTAHAGVDWTLDEVSLQNVGETGIVMEPTYSADGTLTTVKPMAGMGDPAPGTYPNAKVCILAMKTGGDTYSLEIPINLTVEG